MKSNRKEVAAATSFLLGGAVKNAVTKTSKITDSK